MSKNTTRPHQKTFSECFSKIKKTHFSSSASWVLLGCWRRPRTQSFAFPDSGRDNEQATNVDRFLSENFKSTYLNDQKHEEEEENEREGSKPSRDESSSGLEDSIIMVLPCGLSPYEEFKRSMHDVMEARLNHHGNSTGSSWKSCCFVI